MGNYVGKVIIINRDGVNLFYTDFALGSGGVAYYLFDCEGNHFIPDTIGGSTIFTIDTSIGKLIYSSMGK